MHCEDAARALYAGESPAGLAIHLSACDRCRLISEDLAEIGAACAAARRDWAPSPAFRVRLPAAPWRRLAVAASLLLIPLAAWAAASVRAAGPPPLDVASLLDPGAPAPLSDRQLLATLFLEESQP